MTLKEARKSGIKYCEENNCSYTYISANNVGGFYLSTREDNHTVFLVNKNGSLDSYLGTKYAADFHKEYKRKENSRRNNDKKVIAEMCNYDYEVDTD